ncbi:ABC transporter permease [Dactylosporangium sp. NBC_01737]|uniref:ABC transporter permease n=1 Tax=Dactylosporangium sp. NBC_01737 TaxID=2975959 RepID=UPI002E0E7A85|nr:ABC transporter permease [Dactylosporangium sp. NBC_01737]
MRTLRVIGVAWWLQLKMRSRSAFDGLLGILYPLFFSTVVFMMFTHGGAQGPALLSAAVGASVMGVWSSTSTTASAALQQERRQGTLELLVAAPTPLPVVILPVTLSMATVGAYSLVVTLLWGRFVFGVDLAVQRPVQFALAAVVTVVSIGVLGFLLAVSSVRYRTAWALGTALEMPVWLISGFLVPLDLLPTWTRPISWLLAPTWGIDAIRAAAEGRNALPAMALCAGLAVAYGVIGSLLAVRLVDAARRHASLALT